MRELGGPRVGAGRFAGGLGTLSVYVVLLVQANRSNISEGALGTRAKSPISGSSCSVLPLAREGRGSLEGVEIFQMRFIAKGFAPVCRSRYGAGAVGRGAGAGGFVRVLVPLRLCVVLFV